MEKNSQDIKKVRESFARHGVTGGKNVGNESKSPSHTPRNEKKNDENERARGRVLATEQKKDQERTR